MNEKIWTEALLASVKGPVTLIGEKIDNNIIVEFSKQQNDATWGYNVHTYSFNEK